MSKELNQADLISGEVPAKLGDEIGGNGRVYFENVVIDNLIDALLELVRRDVGASRPRAGAGKSAGQEGHRCQRRD